MCLVDLTDYRNPVLIPYQQTGNTITAALENDEE